MLAGSIGMFVPFVLLILSPCVLSGERVHGQYLDPGMGPSPFVFVLIGSRTQQSYQHLGWQEGCLS